MGELVHPCDCPAPPCTCAPRPTEPTGDSGACQRSDWCGPGSHCLCVRPDTDDSRERRYAYVEICPACVAGHGPSSPAAPHAEGSTDTHPAPADAHGAAQGADDGV